METSEIADAQEAMVKFLNHCLKMTLRLTHLAQDNRPDDVCSGFFLEQDGRQYLVAAGHSFKKTRWVIETDFRIEQENISVAIPVNGVWRFKQLSSQSPQGQDLDIAWAEIDFQSFEKMVQGDPRLKKQSSDFIVYRGPTDIAVSADIFYSYASYNRVLKYEALGQCHLERDFSLEAEMTFLTLSNDGFLVFSIPEHRGDRYYKGASGSPILDPSGKIVAILVGGYEPTNELYGYPLKDIRALIKLGTDSCS